MDWAIAIGMPFGPQIPVQAGISTLPSPDSSNVGASGTLGALVVLIHFQSWAISGRIHVEI
jgi:hypothetical protein